MKETPSQALVTGSISYDLILNYPGELRDHIRPDLLHQLNVSFAADNIEKSLGGTATNIAHNLSLLTQKPIRMLAAIGRDGDEFKDFFDSRGIDTSGLIKDEEKITAVGMAITDKLDNQIWGFSYGACEASKDLDLSPYKGKEATLVIAANQKLGFLKAQNQAIELGIEYLYDPGMSLTWIGDSDLKKGIEHSRWLIGNDYEIAQILKRVNMSEEDVVRGGVTLITTLGAEGVRYKTPNSTQEIEAYKVEEVVDPTGAGDAWRGGFMASLIEGQSEIEAATTANALASFAVEKKGTTHHEPTGEEVRARAESLNIK